MLVVLVVEIGLCCDTMKVQIFSKGDFFKGKRAVRTLFSLTVDTTASVYPEILSAHDLDEIR
jgi:hypothetical protein